MGQPAGMTLVVVGHRDPRYPEAEQEAKRLELGAAVRFKGQVSEAALRGWYAGAAMVVVPSFYEGFGLPALEAMAAGVAVVVSDRAALPEVVGDAGLYFDPGVDGAMAAAMGRVWEGESRDLIERGKVRAALFSLEAMARGHVEVYTRVLGGREK